MQESNRRGRITAGLAATIGATAAMGSAAQAEDLTVSTLADTGEGSFRAAIEATNEDPAGKDRILFAANLSGTLTLGSDLPPLEGPVEIVGPGKERVKIDGAGEHRMLASSGDLGVSGLTLANGVSDQPPYAGGGITVGEADLTVQSSRVEGSFADQRGGGIHVAYGHLELSGSEVVGNRSGTGAGVMVFAGTADISASTISGNETAGAGYEGQGGGLAISMVTGGASTIERSTIAGNAAFAGGGIVATSGDLTVDSTLIEGNTSRSTVGGLAFGLGPMGAGSLTMTNSTLTGNEAEWGFAGLGNSKDGAVIESSTITGNVVTAPGSGPDELPAGAEAAGIVQANGDMTLRNSIVSGNVPADLTTIPAGSDPYPVAAGRINAAFDLIGTSMPGTALTETVANSNISATDPQLGALADNGGPTRTMLPAATSPVVNKGSSALTVDQRGLTRPVDFESIPFSTAAGANGADIGAVELQGGPPPPPPPPPPPIPPSNAFSFGWVKLNKKKGIAVLQVNLPGPGQVRVAGGKTVAKFNRAAKAAGLVTVTIKAKGKAAKQLKKKGRAKVKAKVSFTPTGGTANTKSKTVKLVKQKPKRKRKK